MVNYSIVSVAQCLCVFYSKSYQTLYNNIGQMGHVFSRIIAKLTSQVVFNPLSTKLTNWPNTLKQFVGNLPTNCLSVFGHFVGLAFKGLKSVADKKALFYMNASTIKTLMSMNQFSITTISLVIASLFQIFSFHNLTCNKRYAWFTQILNEILEKFWDIIRGINKV